MQKKNEGFANYIGDNHGQWAQKLISSYDNEKRFTGDDQPVVGVTWFAATAYCSWLSALQKANSKGQKETITYRLPVEEEWEWAAGFDKLTHPAGGSTELAEVSPTGGKRKYPWGNEEPDETRANYGKKVGQTTAVGAYPAGATPEGLQDMAGNVWEWMGNKYSSSLDARALRGGSWVSTTVDLRCAARDLNLPDYFWDYLGFRVVGVQSFFDTLKL